MGLSRVWLSEGHRGAARALLLSGLMMLPLVTSAYAQDPAPAEQAPAAQPQPAEPQPPAIAFDGTAGMIFNTIKADKTADFESVMNRLKDALSQSDNPTRQKQAASWKLYRSVEPGQGGNVLYIMLMDPAVPEEEYDTVRLINEAFPSEVQDLYAKLKDAYVSLNKINLTVVTSFGR